jgi:hypothetical protein
MQQSQGQVASSAASAEPSTTYEVVDLDDESLSQVVGGKGPGAGWCEAAVVGGGPGGGW